MHALLLPPRVPYPTRYIIDPVAFFFALIFGPILFTAMSFWALFIPVFALVLGGPAYLLVGTPLLLWYLRRHDGDPNALAALAFRVLVAALILVALISALTGSGALLGSSLWYIGFGMIFGPAWAYFFGFLYQKYRRAFFAKPRAF